MELAHRVQEELRVASEISDSDFSASLADCKAVLASNQESSLDTSDLKMKQGHAGLLTFLVEATRSNVSVESLRGYLEDLSFPDARIGSVISAFEETQQAASLQLRRSGIELAHIVDVSWRLDYNVKGKDVERAHEPIYTVTLITQNDGVKGSYELTCGVPELQDLIEKLKGASKSAHDLV